MKYDAFISYSHAADNMLAPTIQKSLQKLGKPWYKLRALNIFRDETSLAVTPHLWRSIENALSKSSYFILMASPESAKSEWVLKEIQWWLENRSIDTILISLTEGDIVWDNSSQDFDYLKSNSINQVFRGKFEMEPLYSNFRIFRTSEDISLDNPDFKKSIAILAASIHGKEPSDLIGEDIRQHRKIIFLRNCILLTLTVLLMGVIGFAWNSKINLTKSQKNLCASLTANAKLVLERDPALSLRLVEEAHRLDNENLDAFGLAFASYERPMKTIFEGNWNIKGFSKNGQFIAYVLYNKRGVKLMNLQTGKQSHSFDGEYLGFSADTKFFATQSRDSVFFWDIQTGNRLYSFIGKYEKYPLESKFYSWQFKYSDLLREQPAFSPDGRFLVTYSVDKVFLWSVQTGNSIHSFDGEYKGFSPDGQFIAISSGKKKSLWNLHTGNLMQWFGGEYLDFSPDGQFLITHFKGKVLLCNLQTGNRLHSFIGTYLGISPDARFVATHYKDLVLLWDVQTGKQSRSLIGEDLKFSPDNQFFAIKSNDQIQLWEIRTGELLYKFNILIWDDQIPKAHTKEIIKLHKEEGMIPFVFSFSPDGKYLLIESDYSEDWLFRLPSIDSKHVLREHSGTINDIEFSDHNGELIIVSASADSTARVWNAHTGKIIYTLKHPDKVTRVESIGDDFYTDCADYLQYNWDINTGKLVSTEPSMREIFFKDFRQFEVNISRDQTAQLINSITNEPIFTLKGQRGKITCATSSDNQFIATGSNDGTIIIYRFEPIKAFQNIDKYLLVSQLDSTIAAKFGLISNYQKVKAVNVNIIQVE